MRQNQFNNNPQYQQINNNYPPQYQQPLNNNFTGQQINNQRNSTILNNKPGSQSSINKSQVNRSTFRQSIP
jgi:hypothetical protein